MTDKNNYPSGTFDVLEEGGKYDFLPASEPTPEKKSPLETISTLVQIIFFIIMIVIGLKTVLEPRTVNIIIGEDDVLEAIEMGGCE